jgi:hypothetical protein
MNCYDETRGTFGIHRVLGIVLIVITLIMVASIAFCTERVIGSPRIVLHGDVTDCDVRAVASFVDSVPDAQNYVTDIYFSSTQDFPELGFTMAPDEYGGAWMSPTILIRHVNGRSIADLLVHEVAHRVVDGGSGLHGHDDVWAAEYMRLWRAWGPPPEFTLAPVC